MIHALRYTEELEKVGFSTEQAKKSVQIWMELMDQNFATKADYKEHYFMTKTDQMELRHEFKTQVDELRHDVKTQVDELRHDMKIQFAAVDVKFESLNVKFDKLESKLTIKLGIMMAASVGIFSTIIGLMK